ncbi:hypothetical protein HJD18_12280 [Thermoleophilia bacterium SCSIO 60948]|nr:hypothetical protein HJD18_12280 [Thermoleophilia bacterium SCSIO 60948]
MRFTVETGRSYDPRRALRAGLLAVAMLVGLFAASAPADAARGEKPSRVTIRFDGSEFDFRGHVDASKRCTRSRTIVIYNNSIGRDRRVGKGKTNDKGRYRIQPNPVLGGADYYAIARPGGNGSGASCDKAVSKRFRVGF